MAILPWSKVNQSPLTPSQQWKGVTVMSETQRKLDALSPRKFKDLQWCGSALIWPDDHISVAVFRSRVTFFVLNASDEEVTALASWIQL